MITRRSSGHTLRGTAVRKTSRLIAAATLLVATPSFVDAQTPPSPAVLAALVDTVVQNGILAAGAPSVSIVITRGAQTLLREAWGMADVAAQRPADPATIYRIGSLSKQFTASLILRQV